MRDVNEEKEREREREKDNTKRRKNYARIMCIIARAAAEIAPHRRKI